VTYVGADTGPSMDLDYQIVVQLAIPRAIAHAEDVLEIEDALADAIGSAGEIDGHDVSSSKANVFVLAIDPRATFEALRVRLERSFPGLAYVAASRKCCDNDDWTFLYPADLQAFSLE
jgi:hypothetical protein